MKEYEPGATAEATGEIPPSTQLRRGILLSLCSVIAVLVCVEAGLRLFGYPQGTFASLFPATRGLYPANAVLDMEWGPIPYVVRTNSLGLRGEEISDLKNGNSLRVVTIGDSITDGFFVDNEATWQYQLQDILGREKAYDSEVINCARGGGSIDMELSLLNQFALPLKPDIVILTFVTNDISEILGRPQSALVNTSFQQSRLTSRQAAGRFLLTSTAIGEALFDGYLKVRSPSYRKKKQQMGRAYDENRYDIEGGQNFDHNVEAFLNRFSRTDGLVLGNSFRHETSEAIAAYAGVLSHFAAACKRHDARLLFVYFPAYPQVYRRDSSLLINKTLGSICHRLGIEFLDLTDGFRKAGANGVLHLAPLDYHLNPAGNRVLAELIAEKLSSIVESGEMLAPSRSVTRPPLDKAPRSPVWSSPS